MLGNIFYFSNLQLEACFLLLQVEKALQLKKSNFQAFLGVKVNERAFALLHHLAVVLKGQILSFMIMTEMIENFNNDSSCIF